MPRPPRPWFRFYSEALESRKVQKLKPPLFKHWINLMCLASMSKERGTLPSVNDIAFRLRLSDEQAAQVLEELCALDLVDCDGDTFTMHDWDEWQYDSDARLTDGRKPTKRGGSAAEPPQNRRTTTAVAPHRVEESREDTETEEEEEEIAPLSRRRIFVLYDSYMGKPSVTQAIAEQLKAAEEEYPPECIEHCFAAAAASSDGRRSWSYVLSILKRHAVEGCDERPKQAPTAPGVLDVADRFEARLRAGS